MPLFRGQPEVIVFIGKVAGVSPLARVLMSTATPIHVRFVNLLVTLHPFFAGLLSYVFPQVAGNLLDLLVGGNLIGRIRIVT